MRRKKKSVELINKNFIFGKIKSKKKTKDRKFKKWIRFLKKDLAKGFDIPKKVLFGKEKNIRKGD